MNPTHRSQEAAISHGIRNPLASIRCQSELLRDQTDPEDPKRVVLDRLLEEVERLSETVEAIADHSGDFVPQVRVCDVGPALAEASGSLLPRAERRGLTLRREGFDRALNCQTDPVLLSKAVRRLLSNAIDASPTGSEAQIFCDRIQRGIEITIVDQGNGIVPEDVKRLGEAYFSRKAQGIGLGVHLAKRDLERIGAELEFRSRQNQGTTVVVRIPEGQVA